MFVGRLVAIYTTADAGESDGRARRDRGRWRAPGSPATGTRRRPARSPTGPAPAAQVTLIAREAIAAVNAKAASTIGEHETRRNLVTEGVDSIDLVGRTFRGRRRRAPRRRDCRRASYLEEHDAARGAARARASRPACGPTSSRAASCASATRSAKSKPGDRRCARMTPCPRITRTIALVLARGRIVIGLVDARPARAHAAAHARRELAALGARCCRMVGVRDVALGVGASRREGTHAGRGVGVRWARSPTRSTRSRCALVRRRIGRSAALIGRTRPARDARGRGDRRVVTSAGWPTERRRASTRAAAQRALRSRCPTASGIQLPRALRRRRATGRDRATRRGSTRARGVHVRREVVDRRVMTDGEPGHERGAERGRFPHR